MSCKKCYSDRIMRVYGKCSDCCAISFTHNDKELEGYVPRDLNIGGGDDIQFNVCMDCGTIQGNWPLEDPEE